MLLWDIEPEYDLDDPVSSVAALGKADSVVAVTSFAGPALRRAATVLLPLAAWPETEGSFMNLEGRRFDVRPAARAPGEARPGWKILRRLGNECGLAGFDQVNLAEVQAGMPDSAMSVADGLPDLSTPAGAGDGLLRVGEVPMYAVDALCRRAVALQATVHGEEGFVGLNEADAERLGVADGETVRVSQGGDAVELSVRVTRQVPTGAAWVRAAVGAATVLGPAMGSLDIETGKD